MRYFKHTLKKVYMINADRMERNFFKPQSNPFTHTPSQLGGEAGKRFNSY
jgi:hypothetical protein